MQSRKAFQILRSGGGERQIHALVQKIIQLVNGIGLGSLQVYPRKSDQLSSEHGNTCNRRARDSTRVVSPIYRLREAYHLTILD